MSLPPPRLETAAWVALCVALAGAACLAEPGALLGWRGGEVYGHAWVQWWHAQALPRWPAGPEGLLPGIPVWTVVDLLPTAIGSAVGRLAGLAAGYNATLLLAVALAGVGGASLARRVGGDPRVGAVTLAAAPALQGALASGLTEDAFVGVSALALAGVGAKDRRQAVIAGLWLGVVAWCGLVLAWATASAAVALGLAALWADRSRWRSLSVTAGVALGVASPVAWRHLARLGGTGHRLGVVERRAEPLWRLNPWQGADLASFLTPGPVDAGDALVRMHPGYLGLTVLALALLAGRRRWWWVVGGAVALAPGRSLSLAGEPLGVPNPFASLADLLPLGSLLNHHGRVLLLGAVGLSALAALGAMRLPPRWRRAAVIGALLDLALLSPVGWPLPVTERPSLSVLACPTSADRLASDPSARGPDGAPSCLGDLPPGLVLHLPMAGPGVHFQRPLLLQTRHGRPLLLNPNHPGLPPELAATPTGRWLVGLAQDNPPPAPTLPALPSIVRVVLVEEPWVARVEEALGPPTVAGDDSALWWVGEAGAGD